MDSVTSAILAAVAAGAASSGKVVVEDAVVRAYDALKGLLKSKFGDTSSVVAAVDAVEAKPERSGHQVTLQEEMQDTGASDDPELQRVAQELLDTIKQQPGGQHTINQVVQGNGNVFSASGNVTVNKR